MFHGTPYGAPSVLIVFKDVVVVDQGVGWMERTENDVWDASVDELRGAKKTSVNTRENHK